MTSDPKPNSNSRMRTILAGGDEAAPDGEESILARLPKKTQPHPAPTPAAGSSGTPAPADHPARLSRTERAFRAFWTVTGAISLMVNGILLAVIIYLLLSLSSLQSLSSRRDLMILSGLYTNFQQMERATILASIPVDAQIPIDLTVPIQKTTQITLASDTTISNARVRISTASLNIDAPAQVILPAGTVLDVALNFTVPVQGAVPVHLDVPVNIPLAQTELQPPFAGLQKVVLPFLCIIEPNAVDLDNQPICK
ncbi:MAG: hypothetical protein ACOY0R_14145 [Chloroflexota bacterium]